jgi:outer membrane protein assembly factor BamA
VHSIRGKLYILILSAVLVSVLSSCRIAKNLPEGKSLLVKNKFIISSPTRNEMKGKLKDDLKQISIQKPNKRLLGFISIKMWMYVSATKNKKKLTKFRQWVIDKVGEAPVVFDPDQAERSDRAMKNYLFNSGYFYAEVKHDSIIKKKKAIVRYRINTGEAWRFGTVKFPEGISACEEIVRKRSKNSLIKTGDRYDISRVKSERERIELDLRNVGFYTFSRDYIIPEFDSTGGNRTVNVNLKIIQPTDSTEHQQYRINKIYITSDYSTDRLSDTIVRDSSFVREFVFINERKNKKFRNNVLMDAVYFKKNDLYSASKETGTIRRFSEIGAFKFVSLDFVKTKDTIGNYLDLLLNLTPAKKHTVIVSGEANVTNEGFFGTALTLSYKNKNLSKRSDLFLVDLSGGFQINFNNVRVNGKAQIITSDASMNVTYYLNRFLIPFSTKLFSRTTNPKTRINARYSFENRFDFDTLRNVTFLYQLHNFSFSFGYDWSPNRFHRHLLNPLNINFYLLPKRGDEFIRRLNKNPILRSSFEEQITLGPSYSYIYTNQRNDKDRKYMSFRTNVETAGNVLYAGFKLANLKSTNDSIYFIAKRPFSQYFRLDADWRNYVKLGSHGLFAIRTFVGFGVPYGNSRAMPFVKQFFVGGPNSLRGFLIREIGPGSYVDSTTFDIENGIKRSVGFFNQTGDIKMEINAELRFDIFKFIKGALFVDAGNVWLMRKDPVRNNGEFQFNRFYKEFAMNIGAGLRFDFNYFVIRFDYGFPIRDPRLPENKRWTFEKGQFQLAIGYPF